MYENGLGDAPSRFLSPLYQIAAWRATFYQNQSYTIEISTEPSKLYEHEKAEVGPYH